MDCTLYIDESGDHASADADDPVGLRYLGLVGVVIQQGTAYTAFQEALEDLKRQHLPYDADRPPVLHRQDILRRRGAFSVLQDATKRQRFDEDLEANI